MPPRFAEQKCMPRLLPRLLKWLERNPPSKPDYRGPLVKQRRRSPRSLWKPIRSSDEHRSSFLLQNRHRSLLLDHENIITSRKENERHKSLPPSVRLQPGQKGRHVNQDIPREMSEQEKQWWSSPYLRMLSSPVRRCVLSDRRLPTDFLIRFVVVMAPTTGSSRPLATLVPNGIQHPKYSSHVHGIVYYLSCWKEAVRPMLTKGKHKRMLANVSAHSLLSEQISHELRLRVLQEVEMLALRLKAAPRSLVDEVVIRRLTRSEWCRLKSTEQMPWEGASCVIILPPVNKDPRTKQRPQPNYSDAPPETSDVGSIPTTKILPPLPPVSTLHPAQASELEKSQEFLQDIHLPNSRLPVYNGLSLFPSRTQRAALHEKMCEVLKIERQVRWKQNIDTSDQLLNDKPSHAFIVFSSAKTVGRADTVPLAIALWRIRMWEGAGWGECGWLL